MDNRNSKAKAREKWFLSKEGLMCSDGMAHGQWLKNRLERAFCDGWEAALRDNSEAGATEVAVPSTVQQPQPAIPPRRMEMLGRMDRICGTCEYCVAGTIKTPANCHRYPPQVITFGSAFVAIEPLSWCGEWTQRPTGNCGRTATGRPTNKGP